MLNAEYRIGPTCRESRGRSPIQHSAFSIRHSPHSPRRAFTLLELILVMLILTIAVALIVPQMANFGRGRRAGDCAAEIVAVAHFARTKAISDGLAYRLNVDPQRGAYWLTAEQGPGGDFGDIGEEFGRVFTAPEGIALSWSVPPQPSGLAGQQQQQQQAQAAVPYVEFRPDGRTDPAVIRLTDTATGAVTEVACRSATEMFRVTTGAPPGAR